MSDSQRDARLFWVGTVAEVRAALESGLAKTLEEGMPLDPHPGDVVFLEVFADLGSLTAVPGGNAFAACRALKEDPRVRVFTVLREADPYSAEIARFCLADGSLEWDGAELAGMEQMREKFAPRKQRVSVDALLSRLERELATDEGRKASAIQRMMHRDEEHSLLEFLTDADTGLFTGQFASFKLDEEFKRASRFHQPLSLILVDIGVGDGSLPEDSALRRELLAEVASIFLNECRDIDVLARFTETTFLFLLPGTGAAGADRVARRMLASLRGGEFNAGSRLDPKAGLVTIPATGIHDRRSFLARAEACLRVAQDGGGEDGLCTSCE